MWAIKCGARCGDTLLPAQSLATCGGRRPPCSATALIRCPSRAPAAGHTVRLRGAWWGLLWQTLGLATSGVPTETPAAGLIAAGGTAACCHWMRARAGLLWGRCEGGGDAGGGWVGGVAVCARGEHVKSARRPYANSALVVPSLPHSTPDLTLVVAVFAATPRPQSHCLPSV